MSLVDTLLIGATDLADYGRVMTDFSGTFATAARRGSNYTLPGRDGALYTEKPLDVLPVPIGFVLLPKDPSTGVTSSSAQTRAAQLIDNWRDLIALLKVEDTGDCTFTLTRRLSLVAGSYSDETCTAEVAAEVKPIVNNGAPSMRMVIEFVNLDGLWTPVP